MNPDPPPPRPDVESLVRAYLDAEGRTVDPHKILAGVRARGEPSRSARSRKWKRWGVGLAAAASLLIGLTWNFRQVSVRADAVQLVREARGALQPGAERAYQIKVALAPRAAETFPFLAVLARFDIHLWTRSDRLRIDLARPERSWTCGLDERRRAWIATANRGGLLFEPEEVPPSIGLAFDLCAMDLETLLDAMLVDFDVAEARDRSNLSSGMTRIHGTLKTGRRHPRLRSMTLVIDDRTKLVRQVILSRVRLGEPVAEVSFELEESQPQPDDRYRLAGQLKPDAPIADGGQPIRRRRELVRFLGSLLAGE